MRDWPLIGRSDELHRIRELVLDPGCPGVVVAGAAGVGKTRLAVECLGFAEGAGLVTVRVTASRSAADRVVLLGRSAEALVALAGGRRLVVLVDDAHLLDAASATLIHQLAGTNAAFVLVTLRAGAPAPDPVVALWKDGLLERIEMAELNAKALEELLAAVLGGHVDRAAATLLAARSQGNVLFLRELVLGALEDGTLRDEGAIYRLSSSPMAIRACRPAARSPAPSQHSWPPVWPTLRPAGLRPRRRPNGRGRRDAHSRITRPTRQAGRLLDLLWMASGTTGHDHPASSGLRANDRLQMEVGQLFVVRVAGSSSRPEMPSFS